MGALIHPFVRICLLRMKPQDLPSSLMLLALALLAHTVMSVILAAVDLRFGQALAAGAVDTALLSGFTVALLKLQKLPERTVQTLTALAGAGAVIGFVAYPLSLWLHDAHGADTASPALGLGLALLLMLGWSLTVSAHILRHALSAPFYLGLLVSIVFYWISLKILGSLFPLGG